MQESNWLEKILSLGRKIIPKKIFRAAQPIYHFCLAFLGAIVYRFPGKKIAVIGVTGTKGKSSTTEIVNAILEEAGAKTALANTIRYKIGEKEWPNMFKMTMRGRFFTQKFLRQALNAGCTHAVIEVSSEGVPQYRHKFLFLDALIFTNLAPEHIESHGSYENYVRAKVKIAKELEAPAKKAMRKVWPSRLENSEETPRLDAGRGGLFEEPFLPEPVLIVNADDSEAEKFLALNVKNKITYSLKDAVGVKANEKGSSFQSGKLVVHSQLPGIFNVYNMLGAITYARFAGIKDETIKKALEKIDFIRGRMEKITTMEKDGFDVVVDYAHTPESLKAVYESYGKPGGARLICVLGNTGGGRDTWKRKVMGGIADDYCEEIILANEDPYDEDPRKIVEEMKKGIVKKPVEIIMDRREAIGFAIKKAAALRQAQGARNENIALLITGKGTDPYIMEAGGKKTPWDDATVARDELQKLLGKKD